jgi:hypothetical protein
VLAQRGDRSAGFDVQARAQAEFGCRLQLSGDGVDAGGLGSSMVVTPECRASGRPSRVRLLPDAGPTPRQFVWAMSTKRL